MFEKRFGVRVRQNISKGRHNTEVSEKVGAVLRNVPHLTVEEKSDTNVTMLVGAPFHCVNQIEWAEDAVRQINLIDRKIVTAEVVRL